MVVDLFNMVYHCTNFTTVLSVLSTDGDVFSEGDAKTYLEVGECALFSRMAMFSLMATPKPMWKLVSVLFCQHFNTAHNLFLFATCKLFPQWIMQYIIPLVLSCLDLRLTI